MRIRSGAATDVGLVRGGNEDSFIEAPPLFGVADGMGGHIAGDVASSTAVERIIELTIDGLPTDPSSLATLIEGANRSIVDRSEADASLAGMGTTCTLLLVDGDRAYIAHVGDSRAYRFRDGSLEQLTEDHTLVGRLVREGSLTPEEAANHPQRSVITRALGVDRAVQVDEQALELAAGDRFLMCSDGLTGMVSNDVIASVLQTEADPAVVAQRLVGLANEAGGEDNITVVIVDIDSDEDGAEAPPVAAVATGPDRVETAPGPGGAAPPPRRSPKVLYKRLGIASLVTVMVLGGGYAAARWALSNSWFVGANESGFVTIYQGIPEEVVGLSLREVEEETTIAVVDLPESFQENLADGIKVDSVSEARATVADLALLVDRFNQPLPKSRPSP